MLLKPNPVQLSVLQLALSCLVTARAELPMVSLISVSVYELVPVRNPSLEGSYGRMRSLGWGRAYPLGF